MKIVVVGTGFSGCIFARKLADEFGCDIELIERRNHIAGNMYDFYELKIDFGIDSIFKFSNQKSEIIL